MNSQAILPQTTPAAAMIRTLGLIAAICGLIIVAAYQGTYDAVQENKRIAVERAEGVLGLALDLLVRDPGLRDALGANGRRYVDSEYRWDVVLDRWRSLIATAGGGRGT